MMAGSVTGNQGRAISRTSSGGRGSQESSEDYNEQTPEGLEKQCSTYTFAPRHIHPDTSVFRR